MGSDGEHAWASLDDAADRQFTRDLQPILQFFRNQFKAGFIILVVPRSG